MGDLRVHVSAYYVPLEENLGWVEEIRMVCVRFFFQAEDGIRDSSVTGVQTCALPIYHQWILGAVGDPLVMHQPAAPLLDVDAELHRYELPRPASRPAWDGETHRLEVQKEIGRASCRERV